MSWYHKIDDAKFSVNHETKELEIAIGDSTIIRLSEFGAECWVNAIGTGLTVLSKPASLNNRNVLQSLVDDARKLFEQQVVAWKVSDTRNDEPRGEIKQVIKWLDRDKDTRMENSEGKKLKEEKNRLSAITKMVDYWQRHGPLDGIDILDDISAVADYIIHPREVEYIKKTKSSSP